MKGGSIWFREEHPCVVRVRYSEKWVREEAFSIEAGRRMDEYRETTPCRTIAARNAIVAEIYERLHEDRYRKAGRPYIPKEKQAE